MKRYFLMLLWFVAVPGYGQDIKYLYYSNQNSLPGTLIILDEENSIVSTPFSFYLLNKERMIVDTLIFEKSTSNFHQVQRVTVINRNTISAASFFKSMLISVKNDAFVIDKKVDLDSKFKKEHGKIDLIQLFPEGIIARSKKDSKPSFKNAYKLVHYYIPYNGEIIKKNITPPAPVKSEYLRYVSFGSNQFIYANQNVIFNNKEINQLYVYSLKKEKMSIVALPDVEKDSETNDFFYDYITDKYYIINYSESKKTKILEYFPSNHTFVLVKETVYNVAGIINGMTHVKGNFEGRVAHYLIPLKGDVEPVTIIDNEN